MTNWNLEEIFKTTDDFKKSFEQVKQEMKKVSSYKGTLNTKEGLEAFYLYDEAMSKPLEVLFSYASMKFDQNQKDLASQALEVELRNAYIEYASDASFIDNELLETPYETYEAWAKESKVISEHLFSLKKLFDSKEHVLTPNEEKIISNYSSVGGAFGDLYAALQNSDAKPVDVVLSNGKTVSITSNNYTSVLSETENQDDRRKIFEAHFGYYKEHQTTLAQIYSGVVNNDLAYMKSKGYKTFLASKLDSQKIPDEVYLSLINTVRENTKPLKDYIEFRRQYFGLKEYHTYDRFLSFSNDKTPYNYQDSYDAVLKAMEPMGEDFKEHARIALKDGHVDVYPNEGKRSGAYSTEIYGYGPYILLNHTDTIDSAFTLAHECGHSIHTLYSLENQPYATKDYKIFVAEIPSTFNEQLFLDYLLKNSNNKELKIQALEQQIDSIVSTFYRQTLFADFEYQAHSKALKGEALTYEVLNNIMADLYKTYYGIDLDKEELKKFVWAYIPHMYYTPFYVYQYATCLSASMKMHEEVIVKKTPGSKENYLNMLKAGGSNYPIEIVKLGGVDLTTKEPFEAVCKRLEELVNDLKELLK